MLTLVCLLFFLPPQIPEQRTQAFQVSGTIKEVLVKPGDTVKVGQVLARLDDKKLSREVTLQLIALARSYFDFYSALDRQKKTKADLALRWCGSFIEYQITELRLRWAELQENKAKEDQKLALMALHHADLKRRLHVLTSDFSGTIVTIHKRAGESIHGHETIVTIRLSRGTK